QRRDSPERLHLLEPAGESGKLAVPFAEGEHRLEPAPVRVLDGDGFAAALIDFRVALRNLAARLLWLVLRGAHDDRHAALAFGRLQQLRDLPRQPAAAPGAIADADQSAARGAWLPRTHGHQSSSAAGFEAAVRQLVAYELDRKSVVEG